MRHVDGAGELVHCVLLPDPQAKRRSAGTIGRDPSSNAQHSREVFPSIQGWRAFDHLNRAWVRGAGALGFTEASCARRAVVGDLFAG